MFSIRDKNCEKFRKQIYEQSFDHLRFFREKFGLNYKDFNISSNTRKSLFPERSMSDIYYSEAQKHSKILNEFIDSDYVNYDDFIFLNKDTFAVVLLLVYKKNDGIQIFDSYDVAQELFQVDEVSAFDDRSDVKVTHKISVSGLRMLYTLSIEYLFYHHFFEKFNLEEYKKADYSNLNTSTNYDPFATYKKYDKFKANNTKLLEDPISENCECRRLNNVLLEDI